MKTINYEHINTYINEKLRLSAKNTYTCQPKNNTELRQIIIYRIKKEGPKCDLNDIDVSKITDMSYLCNPYRDFEFMNFNGDVSMWDVSNVKDMSYMFYGCRYFNCDISNWNVSNVENMSLMFHDCTIFNANLSKWNVSNVTNMYGMFLGCESFKCDLSRWDVSNVKYMWLTFMNCPTKPDWYVRNHKK
jgi:surface protein